ncbi:hypothetical protein GS597_08855 [Synechococcales cyanobacterium C]|uniref:Uncharacterized protein n=1 Tax=Petrachloros mirabilis ULC683 TaxID=2781853 RepID=A0A8K2A7Z9_9CYAN|nr:phosphotransferase [Petrachloros mirabilis]NCJ06610.1 hypothetical protein [Petrachloros mirabilis ULC683]
MSSNSLALELLSRSQLQAYLAESLTPILPPQTMGGLEAMAMDSEAVGSTFKFMIRDAQGAPAAVVLCSPPIDPKLVALGAQRTRLAQAAVTENLKMAILAPIYEGAVLGLGLSYAVFPYHQPLAQGLLKWWLQRTLITSDLLKLAYQLTAQTRSPVSSGNRQARFVAPLQHLAHLPSMPASLQIAAKETLYRLQTHQWHPDFVLMHGDLWTGNILLNRSLPRGAFSPFVIIDWFGSQVQGYGIYDLIRLAQSIQLSPARLLRHLHLHCAALECDLVDARSHLVTALAHFSVDLGHFPVEKFVIAAERCLKTFDQAVSS